MNAYLNRWQHDVTKILFLSNKITRAKNSPGLQLLRIVNDLVATKTIPLDSIREIVQLGLSLDKKEVLSEKFVNTVFDKLDKLEQNEKRINAASITGRPIQRMNLVVAAIAARNQIAR